MNVTCSFHQVFFCLVFFLPGVDFEGMYRVAGFHDDIEMVRMAFDRGM